MGKEYAYYAFTNYKHLAERWAKGLQYKLRKARYCSMLMFVGVASMAPCLFLGCGRSEDEAAGEVSAGAPEVAAGSEAYAALRAENEALRRDCVLFAGG